MDFRRQIYSNRDPRVSEADEHTVTNNYPEYLKLHTEEQAAASPEPAPELPEIRGLDMVCRAFETTTGWHLDYREHESSAGDRRSMPPGNGTPGNGMGEAGHFVLAASSADAPPLEKVQPLAQAVGYLVDQLLEAQAAVWQREAELAAGIPVTLRPEDQRTLAHRLEAVLRGGAEAIGCQAAALYLLDDATSHLKLRAAWQLPKDRFWQEPRPLRGSVADLEALIGHAVALEDTALLPHWKVPEDFPAALCVPVSTSSTPLGTLWFFDDKVRDFTPEQTHMVEIVAGRLVADLEREVLMRESLRHRQSDVTHRTLVNWQDEQRPRVPPLVDGWQVAGCGGQADTVGSQFHDWCILPDGRIALALGQVEGPPIEAGLTITTLQIALRSHAMYTHEARQMLDRLNESLWTHSTGNRFASLFYAVIDPDSGAMEYGSAGETHSLVYDAQTLDTLTDGNPTLGSDPDHRYGQATRVVELGQTLVIFSRSNLTPLDEELLEPDECRVAELLQKLENATAEEQVRAVAAELEAGSTPARSVVVVRRIY